MKNMMNMAKQAQEMKKRMADIQAQLAQMEVEGQAGGGSVKVTVTGENKIARVHIDEGAADDLETLEDLITVAANNALSDVQAYVSKEMKKVTGVMELPF